MRRVLLLSILAALAITVVLAGCGGDSNSSSSSSPSSSSGSPSNSGAESPSSGSESSGSSIVARYPKIELPSADEGCNGSKQSEGATTIPAKVAKVGEGVSVLVNVCVGGKGPLPFIVDTGAAETIVSSRLADELHLAKVGAPTQTREGDCKVKSQKVKLPAWSVAGVPLQAQTALAIDAPLYNGEEQLEGSIGADVLSRFGAVRIDFEDEALTVTGKEGPAAKAGGVTKPSTEPLPEALVKDEPELTAPMTVSDAAGSVTQRVKVAFYGVSFDNGKIQEWSPDTGAWISYINPNETKKLGLALTGKVLEGRTFCATPAVLTSKSGEWTLAGEPLKPQPIGSTPFVALDQAEGLLGSRTLSEFGSVVFDWAGGRLLLGAG
jgi:Aspartyl protease